MKLRCLLFTAAVSVGICANAAEISTYDTRMDVGPDGAAQASVTLRVTDNQSRRLVVPLGFASVEGLQLQSAPAGTQLKLRPSKEQAAVEVELPEDAAAEFQLQFAFRVPSLLFEPKPEEGQKSKFAAGTRLLRHGLVNTQALRIGAYQATVRLPEGTMVRSVREQLPKPSRKEFIPRVELDRIDGHQGALLQVKGLKQGDRTSMELEVVGDRHSYGWLLVGIVLSLAYLIGFRDSVRRRIA